MRIRALALATWGLRQDMRSLPASLLRSGLVAMLILAVGVTVAQSAFYGAPGQRLFPWLVYINYWLIIILGVAIFPAVIAEEKEQMTLGLLRLAGFKPISIVLGKSLRELVAAAMLLIVQVPFALLTVTLGGVSLQQVTAAYSILIGLLLLIYSIGLFFSVACARTGAAARATGLTVLALWLLPAICDANGAATTPGLFYEIMDWIASRSAVVGIGLVTSPAYDEVLLTEIVIVHLSVAALVFGAALLAFERFNREERPAAAARGLLRSRRTGGLRRPRRGVAAVAWKDFQFLSGGSVMFTVRVVAYAGVFFVAIAVAPRNAPGGISYTGVIAMQFLVFLFAVDCGLTMSRMFREEVKWHTLPSLAVCPFSSSAWAWRKVAAGLPMLAPGVVSFVIALVLIDQRMGDEFAAVLFYYAGLVIFVTHTAVFLSLVLRRGAFAIAFVGTLGINIVLWLLATAASATGFNSVEPTMTLFGLAMIGGSFAFWIPINRKIAQVASK